jgi:hypothetical protein
VQPKCFDRFQFLRYVLISQKYKFTLNRHTKSCDVGEICTSPILNGWVGHHANNILEKASDPKLAKLIGAVSKISEILTDNNDSHPAPPQTPNEQATEEPAQNPIDVTDADDAKDILTQAKLLPPDTNPNLLFVTCALGRFIKHNSNLPGKNATTLKAIHYLLKHIEDEKDEPLNQPDHTKSQTEPT